MRRTVHVTECDNCHAEIPDKKGAIIRANPNDGRKDTKQADYCDKCFSELPGQTVKRRGRRPAA